MTNPLLDGTDPLHAPGLTFSKGYAYWVAPRRYVAAGYSIKRVRLEPGHRDDEHAKARALKCRELTLEMLRWYEAKEYAVQPGTWKWLIARFLSDDFSPAQQVKGNTLASYRHVLKNVEAAIGKAHIADASYAEIMRWKQAMENNGRSTAYIKRWFTHLRMVVSYGVVLEDPDCARIKAILSEIRVKAPKPRKIAPSRAQIASICAAADEAGDRAFALGIALQFWTALRAVDVRGQYIDGQWQDGLVWGQHIDPQALHLCKVTSKTGADVDIDLSAMPEIRQRLLETPPEARIGPVILCPGTGKPYTRRHWANRWARYRAKAGVPDEIWMMDTRAGALTEGQQRGIDSGLLQQAATHKSAATTQRYTRDAGAAQRKVIEMRRGK